MNNEHYYRNQIEILMEDFLSEETSSQNDFGWIADNLAKRMADAAFAVLENNYEVNKFIEDQSLSK